MHCLHTYRSSGGRVYTSGGIQKCKQDKADKQTLRKIPKLTTYYGTQQPDPEVSLLQNNEMDSQEELPLTHNNPSNTPQSSCSSGTEINFGSAITAEQLEYRDPSQWPYVLSENQQKYLVERGPYHSKHQNYHIDINKRQFVDTNYEGHLANGETVNRVWIVYSALNNSVFCFCCKLFRPNE